MDNYKFSIDKPLSSLGPSYIIYTHMVYKPTHINILLINLSNKIVTRSQAPLVGAEDAATQLSISTAAASSASSTPAQTSHLTSRTHSHRRTPRIEGAGRERESDRERGRGGGGSPRKREREGVEPRG